MGGKKIFILILCAVTSIYSAYNYGEALQKAIYFYECQQSGILPAFNRVQWRGPSCINDGKDVNLDLSGGWYDAGDHVKFNFPMAASLTMLCFGVIEYKDAYQKSGQLTHILNNIRFTADYLIRCHSSQYEFYGQVGDGGLDHSFWGPAESVEAYMKRPSFKIDANHPGSDLAAEAAAALSSTSIVFKEYDAAFSNLCLSHAKQLYDFADKYRGKYDASITAAQGYYNSWSGYKDELVWGAIWLYLATSDKSYLDKAEKYYDSLNTEPQSTTKSYKWTIAWDDKSYGCYILLAKITNNQKYKDDAQRWLDYWTIGVNGQKIRYTPGGLAWLDQWGSCRYAANTAFCAFVYSDFISDLQLKSRYHDFAVSQINYIFGDNPLNRSFVVGFGKNPPKKPHHRTAHGIYPSQASDTNACVHVLYGALVGGPGASDDYSDERNNYINNEVACDYNAAFTGALARMYKEFGGEPLNDFPEKETPSEQFYILATLNAWGERFTEIKAILCNKTNTPARVCTKLSYKYFVDLSEVIDAGIPVENIIIRTNYMQGKAKISSLKPYNNSQSVYFLEISYDGDSLYPGTQDSYKREAQFRIELPQNAPNNIWNPQNDWSYKTVGTSSQNMIKAINMPIYDNGILIWGAEPNKPFVNKIYENKDKIIKRNIKLYDPSIKLLPNSFDNFNVVFVKINGRLINKYQNGNSFISKKNYSSGKYFCIVKDNNNEYKYFSEYFLIK
jgi:hypothetical protein